MKILQVTSFFKPSWESGGPARNSYEISKKLVERGHEVTVYTTDGYKWRLNVEKNKPVDVDGIKTYYFRNLSGYLARERVFPTPYYAPIVARKEIMNFDVIHIHEGNTLGVVVHHYAKKYGVPYILQAHGNLAHKMSRERSAVGGIWDALFGYRTLRDASKVIALNRTEAEQYKKMGVDEDKIAIVPNGINLFEYDNLPKRGEFRKKYSIRGDRKIVLFLGRLNKSKGIDLLVKAFADVSEELSEVKLVIVGPDDGFLSALKRQIEDLKISDKILFTGPLSERGKLGAYVDADVFVNPRADEIFGIVFLEACACGTPVICSSGCGIADEIDGKTGFAVRYNRDQLKDAIFKILSDEGLRRRFEEEGGKLVKEKFSWDEIILDVERTYEQVIKNR